MKATLLTLLVLCGLILDAKPLLYAADPSAPLTSEELLSFAKNQGEKLHSNLLMEARKNYLLAVKGALAKTPPGIPPEPKLFFSKAENYFTFSATATTRIDMRQELEKGLEPFWQGKGAYANRVITQLDPGTLKYLATEAPEALADIQFSLGRQKDFYKAVRSALPEHMKNLIRTDPARAKEILTALISKDPGGAEMISLYIEMQKAAPDQAILIYLRGQLGRATKKSLAALESAQALNPKWAEQLLEPTVTTAVSVPAVLQVSTPGEYLKRVAPKTRELLAQRNYLEHLKLGQGPRGLQFTPENATNYFNSAKNDFPYTTRATGSADALQSRAAELTAYLEKPVKAGALKKQIRTLLANRDVRDALLQTQPEEALRFKGLMPKTFIFRRSKYYTYLTDSLKTEVRAAGTDSAKLGRLHERLGRIVATDPSLELADVFIKLQKANAEVPIISHLQGQLGTLDPAAQNKVREFLIKNPKIKLAAAQAPIPTAPAPMTSKITPGRGPLPTPFQPPATGRGLGSTRECLVLSFRTFLR